MYERFLDWFYSIASVKWTNYKMKKYGWVSMTFPSLESKVIYRSDGTIDVDEAPELVSALKVRLNSVYQSGRQAGYNECLLDHDLVEEE